MMARIERARWIYVQAVDIGRRESEVKNLIRILGEGLPVGAPLERIRECEEQFAPYVFPDELVDLWLHAGVGRGIHSQDSTSLFGPLTILAAQGDQTAITKMFRHRLPQCMVPFASYSDMCACVQAGTEPAATAKVWLYVNEDGAFKRFGDSIGELLDLATAAREARAVNGQEVYLDELTEPYDGVYISIDEPSEWPESWGPPRQI